MRHFTKLYLFVLLFIQSSFLSAADIIPNRTVLNNSFYPGEKLTFELSWGFIKAGNAIMEVVEAAPVDGRAVWKIETRAWSAPFIDGFFKVRDTNDSWLDANGIFSYRFRKGINEGNYHKTEETFYDYSRMKVVVPGRGEADIEAFTHDILSSFYYIRTQKLNIGEEHYLMVTTELKKWRLKVKVLKKEKIKTILGLLDTILVEPILTEDGIFKQKGSLKIWLTDDEMHLPVKMASKVFIGSITAYLISFDGVHPNYQSPKTTTTSNEISNNLIFPDEKPENE